MKQMLSNVSVILFQVLTHVKVITLLQRLCTGIMTLVDESGMMQSHLDELVLLKIWSKATSVQCSYRYTPSCMYLNLAGMSPELFLL